MSTRREFLAAAGLVAKSAAVAQSRRVPVIDCHVHAGHAAALTDPWTTIADPAEILRRMNEAGVDKACIFPISNRTYEIANQEIAAVCRKYPGSFIGFAKHEPNTEKGRIRGMLLRECRVLGLRGLKMHAPGPSPQILDVVSELGIPILYHPARVARFEEIAKANPQVDLILAHLGSDMSMDYREHLAAIEVAKTYPNAYLDTSTVVVTRYLEKAVSRSEERRVGKVGG